MPLQLLAIAADPSFAEAVAREAALLRAELRVQARAGGAHAAARAVREESPQLLALALPVVGPGDLQELGDALASHPGTAVLLLTPDPKPENGYYYRSDHFAFAKLGVPMLYIDGGQDLIEGGRAAGEAVAQDYTDKRYHGPKDEFNESWDWSGVMGDLQLYYRLGRMMAMSTSWPNWNDGDEFRGIRDQSCAASEKGC